MEQKEVRVATINFVFHGLCGFVPGGDLKVGPVDWVGVFLVKADQGARERLGTDLPAHYPFVRFKLSDLEGHANGPDSFAYWLLDEEDLVIVTGKSSESGVQAILGREGREVPDPNDPEGEKYFDWISEIDKVRPGSGHVSGDCLLAEPVGNRVGVRIHLLDGLLRTNEINNYDGGFVVSQFDPFPGNAAPPVRHALASSSVLTIYNVPGQIKLRTQKFGTNHCRELVFRAQSSLTIHIYNFCMADLLEDPQRVPPVYPGADFDFEWHYVLSQNAFSALQTRRNPIPVAVKFAPRDGSGGREPARCAETAFVRPSDEQVLVMTGLARAIQKSSFGAEVVDGPAE